MLGLVSCGTTETSPDWRDELSLSVELFGGRERLLCKWSGLPEGDASLELVLKDGDSRDFAVSGTSGETFITGVPEGLYSVKVNYLRDGVSVECPPANVTVYGEKYESSLTHWQMEKMSNKGGSFKVYFSSVLPAGVVGQEFVYTDQNGENKTYLLKPFGGGLQTTLSFIATGDEVRHRTVYCPSKETGDFFYSSFETIENVDYEEPAEDEICEVVNGYRGIWFDLGQASEYGSKYSGGLGTYTNKHIPMAIYSEKANKTFFVYGGTPSADRKYLQCMVGCYDHSTGLLRKPRMVMDKGAIGVADPHDNPTIQIDKDGYIWVFVSGRGNTRPGKRYKSVNPYDISAFRYINESIMAYPQVMYHKDKGFFLFFTRYDGTRQLFYQSSKDGVNWKARKQLASIKEGSETKSGHYQTSNIIGDRLCTAFNRHIDGNCDERTNLYYVESSDWGETWTTASGEAVKVPVTDRYSNSLVIDYQSDGRFCYMKDLNFDINGRPVILVVTSDHHDTGPVGGIRNWEIVSWNGASWDRNIITTSSHNYDSGSIWIEGNEWVVIGPTDEGPQKWGAGGEVVKWTSRDNGRTWEKTARLTKGSEKNHTYMRRPWNTSDGFYSFWADGNPDKFTQSNLYFCDKSGKVFKMPYEMKDEWEAPAKMNF